MKDKQPMERRQFFKLSLTAFLGGLTTKLTGSPWQETSSIIEEAARKVGKLPRRKLGYSQREVSVLIGFGDMDQLPLEAGLLCGMNYWHKANRWMRNGAPEAIIKNRDAHYCQVTVDRVDGNHYTGHQDEEAHYRYVKEAVEKTGLRYFDDMQFHYGYHNIDELKTDRSFIRAFERLKKEGLVKHLCLSQHSYAGSSRVENGQSDAEILTAVVDDGHYEHAQFMYSYGSDPEMDEFIEYAKKKNFGTIAMKTGRGIGRMKQDEAFMDKLPEDTSPYNAMVRWLTTETNLDAAVIRVKNLEEFTETYSGVEKPLRARDVRALKTMTAEANSNICRMCGKCQQQCPKQIPISDILRFERYAMDDHDWNKARALYAGLPVRADQCDNCGSCIQACPLHLPIPKKLAKDHILLS
jgi:predicted aldo/keto reductase-like oxidoreductase